MNARCCQPVPGDRIIGVVTVGRGVSVHRQDCPNTFGDRIAPERRVARRAVAGLEASQGEPELGHPDHAVIHRQIQIPPEQGSEGRHRLAQPGALDQVDRDHAIANERGAGVLRQVRQRDRALLQLIVAGDPAGQVVEFANQFNLTEPWVGRL